MFFERRSEIKLNTGSKLSKNLNLICRKLKMFKSLEEIRTFTSLASFDDVI
jgi:hypothetical protein